VYAEYITMNNALQNFNALKLMVHAVFLYFHITSQRIFQPKREEITGDVIICTLRHSNEGG
jgi:hypothetical protein